MQESSHNWSGARRWSTAWIGLVGLMLWAMPATAERPPAEAVQNLEDQIEVLEETYLMPAVLEQRYRVETRFNEAKVSYLLEDYDRATIMLASLVDTLERDEFASYDEALFLLGDSLYEVRRFRAARTYFRDLLEEADDTSAFYQPAIVRLLEIAAQTDDYTGVDELYARLDDLENVSASIHYTRGKTLFDEGRYEAARPWFQRAARDEEYAFTARYFEAVTLVAEGELDQAEQIFAELTRSTPTNAREREVLELAYLGRGRLAYEQGDYPEAVDQYLQLPRNSQHFGRALYELTWALVAEGNYQAALRNLEILMISDPEPQFVPQARAMMADMAMRLGQYDNARQWFDELLETFSPVRDELQAFIEEHDELDEFFVGLVRDELEGLRPDFLPQEVTDWVEEEELTRVSRQLVSDGAMTEEDIDEVLIAIEELEAAIDMGSSIEAFPALSEGWTQGMQLESRLVALQNQLLDWELRQVRPFLGAAEEERLQEIEAELAELQERERQAPTTQEELQDRTQRIREEFDVLSQELDQVAFEIDGLEEVLEGIAVYVRSEAQRLSQADREEVEAVRRELNRELEQLQDERRQLSRELDRTRRAFGARDESLVEFRNLRREIQELQAERAELVEASATELSGAEAQQASEVADMRRHVPSVQRRLDRYFDELDRLVEDRMDDIRVTLASEKASLEGYQEELAMWRQDTEETVAELAMLNYMEVNHAFEQLVRRSHLGLVDVDWQQLEDAREDRQRLVDEKIETQDMLREAFPDLQ